MYRKSIVLSILVGICIHTYGIHAQLEVQTQAARNILTLELIRHVAHSNNIGYAARLLDRGAQINGDDPATGITPLMSALTNRSVSYAMIQFLKSRGSLINARGHLGQSSFLLAAEYNQSPAIMQLLINPPGFDLAIADVTVHDNFNRTGLNLLIANAIYNQHNPQWHQNTLQSIYIVLNKLISLIAVSPSQVEDVLNRAGVYREPQGQLGPTTTLMWLARLGNADLLNRFRLLLQPRPQGIQLNVNALDIQGRTAYDWAPTEATRRILLSWGVKPSTALQRNRLQVPLPIRTQGYELGPTSHFEIPIIPTLQGL